MNKITFIVSGVLTFAFIIVAIALYGVHTVNSYSINGQHMTASGECESIFSLTSESSGVKIKMSCAWYVRDLVIGYIALALALAFVVIFGLRNKFNSSIVTMVKVGIGALSVVLLLVAFIIMLVDLCKGKMPESGGGVKYSRATYIVNAIFVILTCLSVAGLSIYEFLQRNNQSGAINRPRRTKVESVANTSQNVTQRGNASQLSETSMIQTTTRGGR